MLFIIFTPFDLDQTNKRCYCL